MNTPQTLTQQIDALLQINDPYSACSVDDDIAFQQLLAAKYHDYQQHHTAFRQLNLALGEPIPVGVFKQIDLNQYRDGNQGQWFSSSGTSGKASKVFYDALTLQRIFTAQRAMFQHYDFIQHTATRYLIFAPDPRLPNAPSYSFSFSKMTECAPIKQVQYAIKTDGSLDIALIEQCLHEWQHDTEPIYLFGLTLYFEQWLLHHIAHSSSPTSFAGKVKVITGGGWKGMTQRLERPQIVQHLTDVFCHADIQVHDIYGLTEHPLHYLSCEHQNFHLPKYSRFQILSALGKPCAEGEAGLIRLQNPFSATFPNDDIVTQDMGEQQNTCACGSPLPSFRFIKRQTDNVGTCAYESQQQTD